MIFASRPFSSPRITPAARRVAQWIRDTGNALADFATGHPGRASGTCEKSVSRLPYIIAYALSDDDTALTIPRVIHTLAELAVRAMDR